MTELVTKFILTPVLAILGIIIVGAIIKDAIGITSATLLLFTAVGGFTFFAHFYKK
jgi:hypothetical protein